MEQPQFTEEEQFVDTSKEELLGEEEGNPTQRVQVGLHPLGGIALAVTGPTGETQVARLDLEQAWNIMGHMSALTSMFISTAYAQAAQQEQQATSRIVLPR